MTRLASLFLAVVALFAVGCGAATSYDICLAQCSAGQRCGVLSDSQAVNCRTDCDNKRGSLADQDASQDRQCTNSGVRRNETLACYHDDCNKILGCLNNVDGCINRN